MPKTKVDRAEGEMALSYTRVHERAIHKIGTTCSPSAMKVYLYINFNCNLASGITHRLSKSDIANYWGMDERTVRSALVELERIDVLEIKEDGDFMGVIPHQGLIQHMAHVQAYEKKERGFYQALRRQIAEKSEGRTQPLPFGSITRLYEALIAKRMKNNGFYPKAKGFGHIQEKLDYYVPDADDD